MAVHFTIPPDWLSPKRIAETRKVFEPLYGHPLSDDDVCEILINSARR